MTTSFVFNTNTIIYFNKILDNQANLEILNKEIIEIIKNNTNNQKPSYLVEIFENNENEKIKPITSEYRAL